MVDVNEGVLVCDADEVFIPTDPEIVTVKIRTTDSACDWGVTVLCHYDGVRVIFKWMILFSKELDDCFLGDSGEFSDISWVEARVSDNDHLTVYCPRFSIMLFIKRINNTTVHLILFQNFIFVNNLN